MNRFLACFLAFLIGLSVQAQAQDADTFELNVRFTIAIDGYDTVPAYREHVDAWLDRQIALAEDQHDAAPALRINDTRVFTTEKAGIDLTDLVFDDRNAVLKFMDTHFDTVATSKTTGYMQILVTNRLCIGTYINARDEEAPYCNARGGAFLPHGARISSRKTGLIIVYNNANNDFTNFAAQYNVKDWFLAHEFGHAFGLRHTFSKYYRVGRNKNCNADYDPKSTDSDPTLGYCNSCLGDVVEDDDGNPFCDGELNLMDYCGGANDAIYLNQCQIDRAAKQRTTYSTSDHYTNYKNLAGDRGGESCDKDSDCSSDQYCDKGTLTVGKNRCKPKRINGEKCTRKKQCQSNRCRYGKCKA